MKHHKSFPSVWFFLILPVVCVTTVSAQPPDKTIRSQPLDLLKVSGSPNYTLLNINNFTTWVRSDAFGERSLRDDNQGYYPRGTGNAIYTDGIIWGARCFINAARTIPAPRQPIRVGGKQYRSGLTAGRVVGFGTNAVPQNPNDPDVRIYRVRRDYASMSSDEYRRDAAEMNEISINEVTDGHIAALRAQYDKDWKEWPVQYGAPFIDRNGNGVYDPPPPFNSTFTVDSLIAQTRDEPGVAGIDPNSPADQVIWTVANDLDVSRTVGFESSEPVGLEVQFTVWGYKRTDALGNIIFKRARIINKGGVEVDSTTMAKGSFYLDSMFVCLWSDIDLGTFSDDLAGCDTTLNLAYVYNDYDVDGVFQKFNLPPPAIGYELLSGGLVPSVGDSAVFDLKQRRINFKNRGMTSCFLFAPGGPYSDPCNRETSGYSCNTAQWWKLIRGFAPFGTFNSPDVPWASGPFPPSKYPFSGDPVTGQGWLDGLGMVYSFPSGDRRPLPSTGPFVMAPGDTQEVVVAVIGGLGADRISSIAVMKNYARQARAMYDGLMKVPQAPTFSSEVEYPSPTQATVKIKADGRPTNAKAISATLREQDGSRVSDVQLFDDGLHQDGTANDGVFANSTTNIRQRGGLYLDAVVTDRDNNVFDFKRVADFITTVGTLDIVTPAVFSDNINNDGKVNPGENVRYGFTLTNGTPFALTNLRLVQLQQVDLGKSLKVNPVPAGGQFTLLYNPNNPDSYFSFQVPARFPDTLYRIQLKIIDQQYNEWRGIVQFPIVPLEIPPQFTALKHLRGKADGSFDIRIINPSELKNHLYVIYGLGPIDTLGTPGLILKDSTDGRVLLQNQPLPDTLGHNITPIDGFKIFRGTVPDQYLVGMKDWSIPSGQRRWTWVNANLLFAFEGFNGAIGWDEPAYFFFTTPPYAKTLKPTDLTNTLIRFATTDTAGKVLSSSDPNWSFGYRYLRMANQPPAQPEFIPYIVNAGAGYAYQDFKKSIPFSAWDVEASPPRRLAVGFLENNITAGMVDGRYWPPASGQADNTSSSGPREWFFIFNTDYSESPNAILTKDILNNHMPVMWWGTPARNGNVAFESGDEFLILAVHPLTSNDVWIFNPGGPLNVEPGAIPQKFDLSQNYPNPFNPSTTIRFALAYPSWVELKIYDLLGQEVAILETGERVAGRYSVSWNGKNRSGLPVSSGVYFYRLRAKPISRDLNEFVETKKLVLLK